MCETYSEGLREAGELDSIQIDNVLRQHSVSWAEFRADFPAGNVDGNVLADWLGY